MVNESDSLVSTNSSALVGAGSGSGTGGGTGSDSYGSGNQNQGSVACCCEMLTKLTTLKSLIRALARGKHRERVYGSTTHRHAMQLSSALMLMACQILFCIPF